MSARSAGQAKRAGYRNIRVLLAGEPGWVRAGYPTYATHDFVRNGNIVLIDLRSREKDSSGRIPRSVSIPLNSLEDGMADIPAMAPVVLYADTDAQALQGMHMLRQKGFRKVSLVEGNLNGWVTAGGVTEKGPPATTVTWKRKPGKWEISLADFRKALAGTNQVLVLDVRTDDEASADRIQGSRHIPLDQLVGRMNELPRDKTIYIFCTTGARAEMASRELRKNGFRSYYLASPPAGGPAPKSRVQERQDGKRR